MRIVKSLFINKVNRANKANGVNGAKAGGNKTNR